MQTFKRGYSSLTDSTLKSASKYFNHAAFKGIKEDKNIYAIDQDSFHDVQNMWVNDDMQLSSRDPLIGDDSMNTSTEDGNLVDIYRIRDNLNIFVYEKDGKYAIVYDDKKITDITKYNISTIENYIIVFNDVEAKVLDTNKLDEGWIPFTDVVEVPVTNITAGSQSTKSEKNKFTDAYKEEYIITNSSDTKLPKGEPEVVLRSGNEDIEQYIDNPEFLPKLQVVRKLDMTDDEDGVVSHRTLNINGIIYHLVAVGYSDHFNLSYDGGLHFKRINYPEVTDLHQAVLTNYNESDGLNGYDTDSIKDLEYFYQLVRAAPGYNPTVKEYDAYGSFDSKRNNFILCGLTEDGYYFDYLTKSKLYSYNLGLNEGAEGWESVDSPDIDCFPIYKAVRFYTKDRFAALGFKKNVGNSSLFTRLRLISHMHDEPSSDRNTLDYRSIPMNIGFPDINYASESKSIPMPDFEHQVLCKICEPINKIYDNKQKEIVKDIYACVLFRYKISKNNDSIYNHKYDMSCIYLSIPLGCFPKFTDSTNNQYFVYKNFESTSFGDFDKNDPYKAPIKSEITGYIINRKDTTTPNSEFNRNISIDNFAIKTVDDVVVDSVSNGITITITGIGCSYTNDFTASWKRYTWKYDYQNAELSNIDGGDDVEKEVGGTAHTTVEFEPIGLSSNEVSLLGTKNAFETLVEKSNRPGVLDVYGCVRLYLAHSFVPYELENEGSNRTLYFNTLSDNRTRESAEMKIYQNNLQVYPESITYSDGVWYARCRDIIYTNYMTDDESLIFTYTYKKNENKFTQVPDVSLSDTQMYLGFGNELWITSNTYDDDGNLLLAAYDRDVQSFISNITGMINISTTEVALFFRDKIRICARVEDENFGFRYDYYNTKLSLGTRLGDSIINTLEGSYTLFPTIRGLASMNYQEFMATTDQVVQYITDDIRDLWTKFYKDSERILIIQHRSHLFITNGTQDILLYDFRTNAWWFWKVPWSINKLFSDQENLRALLKESSPIPLIFKRDKDLYYGDILSPKNNIINTVRKDRTQFIDIDWFLMSQPLHFNAPSFYKNIKQLIFQLDEDVSLPMTIDAQIKLYRKKVTTRDPEVIEFKIDELRTFVKRFNYWKINELQWGLSNDTDTVTPAQIKLNTVTVKYELGDEVR